MTTSTDVSELIRHDFAGRRRFAAPERAAMTTDQG
jgi:hypothetical protein